MNVDGEAFKKARLKKLLSPLNLASEAGVSPNIIKNIEKGKTPRLDLIRKVILALGLTVEEALEKRMISH
ncbi:MAG: helix-turn-helix domain-containing protein [Deltaproteobacteria bacterium]|jgi:transcriptional regulator with XRE-family HTH domain|nr:helix-turn-helix domain-containing protein [Deltaproteobacteria bacterium]MDR1296690.1 helix-turn-helix domain-containing protein [Deltaproteobacteria bacterium]